MKRAALFALGLVAVGLVVAGNVRAAPGSHKPTSAPPAATAPAAAPAPSPVPASGETARAVLKDATGKTIGEAMLEETPHGVIINLNLTAAPPGLHAFHIHSVGVCDAATGFKGAGGHFNPGAHKHGIKAPEGKHAGDMPNVDVPESGKLKVEIFNPDVTLKAGEKNSLLDSDGSALVMHKSGDDLVTDPTGNAGDRQACGVLEKSK